MPTNTNTTTTDDHVATEAAPPAKAKVVRYKTTPLPMKQIIPLVLVMVNESLCSTMLQPIVGLYVAFLRGVDPDRAGYTSGFVVSVFMLGQVCCCTTWGAISDRYGRRFPLISGLFTSGLCMLGFGLATNLWVAVFFRFLQGCFNGNILVVKTMIADITDKTNQAKGFSMISFVSGVGFLIGPALGGMLYNPSQSSALSWMGFSPDGIFATHPALMPSLFIFCYSIVGMTACTLFIKESNPNAQPLPRLLRMLYPCMWREAEMFQHPPLIEETDDDAGSPTAAVTIQSPSAPNPTETAPKGTASARPSDGDDEDPRLYDKLSQTERLACGASNAEQATSSSEESETAKPHPAHAATDDDAAHPAEPAADDATPSSDTGSAAQAEEDTKFGFVQAFKRPVTRFMLSQYIVLCLADRSFEECFPLLAIASLSNHGMELSSASVGYILLFNSVPAFISNTVFAIVCKKYHDKMGMFRISALCACICVATFAISTYIPFIWFRLLLVVICTSSLCFFCSWCYTLNTMLTARSAPNGKVGVLMGVNQTCGSVAKGLGPLLAAPIFAWSLEGEHIPPFNHLLVFVLSSSFFLLLCIRSYRIHTVGDDQLEMA